MEYDYDAIIVGAGPAGTTTARFAALGGARVLVLEKRQEIGTPVRCGEGIAPRWAKEVGIPLDGDWLTNRVKGAKIISPNGTTLTIDDEDMGTEIGMVIERDRFDKALARMAVDAGADLRVKTRVTRINHDDEGQVCGVRVVHLGKERDITAPIVVGADGFESQVGHWVGIKTTLKPVEITSNLQYRLVNLDIPGDYCEFHLAPSDIGGYFWNFPKSKTEANIGFGILLANCHEPAAAKKHLDRFIAEHPLYSKGQAIEMVGGGTSLSAPLDRTVAQGVMIVGDSARQINSITGGGIGTACTAAKVAGQTIAAAVKANDYSEEFLQMYERGWRELMEENLYNAFVAKEKLALVPDHVIDMVVGTLAEVGIERLSVEDILDVIAEHHPELLEELADII